MKVPGREVLDSVLRLFHLCVNVGLVVGQPGLQGGLVDVRGAVHPWVPKEDDQGELGLVVKGHPKEELVREVLCKGSETDDCPIPAPHLELLRLSYFHGLEAGVGGVNVPQEETEEGEERPS